MAKITTKSKANFSDCYSAFRSMLEDLRGGNIRPAYLLMGEESYFIDRLSDAIIEGALKPEERDFNLSTLYGKQTTADEIVSVARSFPMLPSYNVVLVKEAQSTPQLEKIDVYFKAPQPSTVLILCYKEGNIDRRGALYKKLVEGGSVFESVRPRDYEISPWLIEVFRNRNKTIDPKASAMLVEYLGTDMAKIVSEVDKLLTAIPDDKRSITPDDIENNIGISKDYNNFELTKAISERDMLKAIRIAEHFAGNPKDNPLVVTMSLLFTHFVRIFSLGLVMWQAKNRHQPVPSDFEMVKILKVANTFFVKEYKQAAVNYPSQKSFQILGLLREYDMKCKGMNAGSAENGDLLKELLFKIFTI